MLTRLNVNVGKNPFLNSPLVVSATDFVSDLKLSSQREARWRAFPSPWLHRSWFLSGAINLIENPQIAPSRLSLEMNWRSNRVELEKSLDSRLHLQLIRARDKSTLTPAENLQINSIYQVARKSSKIFSFGASPTVEVLCVCSAREFLFLRIIS